MRRDLNNIVYHPRAGAPLYYQDLSMIAWVWFFGNRLTEDDSSFSLDIQTMNNFANSTRCSYFMENASAIDVMDDYFDNVHNSLDYTVMAEHFGWKIEIDSYNALGKIIPGAEYEELIKVYVNYCDSGMRLFAAYIGRCVNLMRHWVHVTGDEVTGYKGWVDALQPKVTAQNPFIEGCLSMQSGLRNLPYAWAFLTCVTNVTKVIPARHELLVDRRSWLTPLSNYPLMQQHRKYILNDIPGRDEINFVS